MVRAKVAIQSKNETAGGCFAVEATTVYGCSEEDDEHSAMKARGKLSRFVLNERAADQIEVGKEYYLDLTPAE